MHLSKRSNGGFTLLEILIVVVILGALAALAIPAYTSTTEKARKQEAYQALAALRESQSRYYSGNNTYAGGLTELDFNPNTALPGQTPIFTYSMGTGSATTFSAQASRTGNGGATGGSYTVKISETGIITSNF